MSNDDIVRLARAYQFAAEQHVHHRRKGAMAEPYLNHLTEAAELVARATRGKDVELVMAAVLHDVVEDTDAGLADVEAAFGARVAGLVGEVSDDKTLTREKQKATQLARAAHASAGAQIIKLADKTSNLRSIAASPPVEWDAARTAEYVAWATQVVDVCRGANAWLAGEFDRAAAALLAA